MIQTIKVDHERYDTRMYCNLVYTNAFTNSATAIPLHFHLIVPRGKPSEKFPLLIYLGGGGWRVSAPERHLPELAYFASQGFVVASVEYRTTANSRFPSQIEDVKTAIRFLRKHSEQFHIDSTRVHIMGGSAGGYLTAMVALTGGTEAFKGNEHLECSDEISSAICLYGIYDFKAYQKAIEDKSDSVLPIKLFLPELSGHMLEIASPVSYVHKKKIPFLLLHGTNDTMVSCAQSEAFHNALEREGADVELYLFEGVGHADAAFSQPATQEIILKFITKSWR